MAIYAQHGHGKSEKIEQALRQGTISGVVLSPKDESPANLQNYIVGLRAEFGEGVTILFDPQLYATTVNGGRLGHLPAYPYFSAGLTRSNFIAPSSIARYVSETITFQMGLGLDRLISPSVLVSDLRDTWSQISLSLALESISFRNALSSSPDLLLSLIIDENAFRGKEALDEILDIVTGLSVRGFYVVIRRNDTSYQAAFEPDCLANVLYFTYVLSALNGFEVVMGYSDLCGILLQAVGAKSTCTGWHNSLRQFSMNRFLPSTGGRTPRPRYTSTQLLNSILVLPELQAIHRIGSIADVLSQTAHDAGMGTGNPANALWPPSVSTSHHWEVLSRISLALSSQETVGNKLSYLEAKIRAGIALYTILEQRGVVFEQSTGQRELGTWIRAIRTFRNDVSV